MKSRIKLIAKRIIIVAVWLIVWQAASVLTGLEFLLASPVSVFWALVKLLGTKVFYVTLINSFIKITLGFLAAFAAATVLGLAAGKFGIVEEILKPPVQLMKTLPMTSFIILLLIWFGSENVSVFIAFIVVFPIDYTGVIEGVQKTDIRLKEMAEIFEIPALRRVRCIYVPQILPFVEANLKTGIGMCWKAGVSAEVIGLVRYSIGEQLYYSKLYLMTAELFAWSIVVVAASMAFETLFIKLLKLAVDVAKRPGKFQERAEKYSNHHVKHPKDLEKYLNNSSKEEENADGGVWGIKCTKGSAIVESVATGGTAKERVTENTAVEEAARNIAVEGNAGNTAIEGAAIKVTCINKSYGDNQVLKDFSAEIPKGSICCIMGESGVGKTTLLRLIMGLEKVDSGIIEGTGKSSAVFQENRLVNWLTTFENVMLVLKGKKCDNVKEHLQQLLPSNCIDRCVEELSGGMKRRVAVVRAVMRDCDTICMDEPFAGLDDENRALVREYILKNQNGRTILLVTHNREDAEALKAQICLLTSQ